jgi:hypothetical protein
VNAPKNKKRAAATMGLQKETYKNQLARKVPCFWAHHHHGRGPRRQGLRPRVGCCAQKKAIGHRGFPSGAQAVLAAWFLIAS